MTAEPEPKVSDVTSESGWPKLMARMMEDITRSELHRFEANLAASLRTSTDRAIASLFRVASAVVGGVCLITALVLFVGELASLVVEPCSYRLDRHWDRRDRLCPPWARFQPANHSETVNRLAKPMTIRCNSSRFRTAPTTSIAPK